MIRLKISNGLNEANTRARLIDPSLEKAGWKPENLYREYEYTDGKINTLTGKRGERNKVDYVLFYRDKIPLAVIEAKKEDLPAEEGDSQANKYGRHLGVLFRYSTNGHYFIEHDYTRADGLTRRIEMDEFPTPEELKRRFQVYKEMTDSQMDTYLTPFHYDSNDKREPRYYQYASVNKLMETIVKGKDRAMVVMATGVGKTYTAFQLIHRLRGKTINGRHIKKILFLADRNILVDQTKRYDFAPFGDSVMTKIENRNIDTSKEIFFGIYQQLMLNSKKEALDDEIIEEYEFNKTLFQDVGKDFFDLIIIDECHRGGVREDSQWSQILDYFKSAIHVGLTATPKIEEGASNLEHFGEPVYTYSLKDGIQDGFLAPYEVTRYYLDVDQTGIKLNGVQYTKEHFDKKVVVDARRKIVAKQIADYLKKTDPLQKTIIFCEDTEHAAAMVNELKNHFKELQEESQDRYIMRITGNDLIGKSQLDNFMDDDSKYPAIVTTSQMLTTGVNIKMCKLIVLDRTINSMTEFKQIIGRGTRLHEVRGKKKFMILDFKGASAQFSHPDFDGEPASLVDVKVGNDGEVHGNKKIVEEIVEEKPEKTTGKKVNIYGVPVQIIGEKMIYFDENGNHIPTSMKEMVANHWKGRVGESGDFLESYLDQHQRKEVEKLYLEGKDYLLDIWNAQNRISSSEYDPFEVVMHVVYDKNPVTRSNKIKKTTSSEPYKSLTEEQKEFVDILLLNYNIGSDSSFFGRDIWDIPSLKEKDWKSPVNTKKKLFGGKEKFNQIIGKIERQLYEI